VADVPLLDEVIDLLGPAGPDDQEAARAARERLAYATGVLRVLDTEEDPDGEVLRAVDLIDADRLADRHAPADHRDTAQRAAADRQWTYGHVVVDEAQELSEMDWRMLMRRCPARSFTIVGDRAQRQSPAGARAWADMLDRYVPARWAFRELTVNYRMPAELMDLAAQVLARLDPAARPPESLRHNGIKPWARQVAPGQLTAETRRAARTETDRAGAGSVVVIAPPDTVRAPELTVLTPRQAKGLEFDAVLVVQPQRILADPHRGAAELYVALTRATQRLGLLHTEPLPEPLSGVPTA
jgi:DNA helicase IV